MGMKGIKQDHTVLGVLCNWNCVNYKGIRNYDTPGDNSVLPGCSEGWSVDGHPTELCPGPESFSERYDREQKEKEEEAQQALLKYIPDDDSEKEMKRRAKLYPLLVKYVLDVDEWVDESEEDVYDCPSRAWLLDRCEVDYAS